MLNMTAQEERRLKNIMARYQDNYHDKHCNPLEFEIYNPKRRNWDQTIEMRRFADTQELSDATTILN